MREVLDFVIVLAATVGIASSIALLYSLGLRLWEGGTKIRRVRAPQLRRLGGIICFMLCIAIVVYALWLIVPAFH